MPNYDYGTINKYAKYISNTEDGICYQTLERIRNVLLNSGFRIKNHKYIDDDGLKYSFEMGDSNGNEFLFLVQGSFANATCIRQESDLDIAIISEGTFRPNYRPGASGTNYGFINSSFDILEFKNKLIQILKNNGFNPKNGNKCINVDFDNSNKKSFDIVPCLRYRDYSNDYRNDPSNYVYGTLIKTNDGNEVINYPEQSILNSTAKNNNTNYYYKKVVRILKNIKSDMEDDKIEIASKISSFELECLIYNVPNNYFSKYPAIDQESQLKFISLGVVNYLYTNLGSIGGYKETNEILPIYSNPSKNLALTKQFIMALFKYYQ